MEHKIFELLREGEHSWWYRGRSAVVALILKRQKIQKIGRSLDFGAGYGPMFDTLQRFSARVEAFEPDPITQEVLRARAYSKVYDSAEDALGNSYDLIGLFDVVEHIENDAEFLNKLRDSLVTGGRLVITIPAYQWLWSEHDVENHHFRRYTKGQIVGILKEAGYTIEYAGYWNMFLFLPAALTRLFGKSGGGALLFPPLLDSLLFTIVRMEVLLMRFVTLPFGLSICVIARKPE